MKSGRYFICFMMGVLIAGCSLVERFEGEEAKSTQIYSPGENLVYPVPDGWQTGYDKKNEMHWMTGLIPGAQQLESWRDMLSIQVIYGATHKNPAQFIAGMATSAEKVCPGSKGKVLEEGEQDGYQYLIWFHDCQENPNTRQMEVSLLKATLGSDNFYVVQRAWRSQPSDSDLAEWTAYLNSTSICDTRFDSVACPK